MCKKNSNFAAKFRTSAREVTRFFLTFNLQI